MEKCRVPQAIKRRSDSIAADICLGVAIARVNTLIGIGLILVFA